MEITSLDIINDLSTIRDRLINTGDFDSEKLSIIRTKKNKMHVYYDHDPLFLVIKNLKGYFEKYNDNKHLTIIFNNEDKKLMYIEIFKKINKDMNENHTKIKFLSNNILPLNILINIHSLVFAVRYKRVYINNYWYDEFYEKVQVYDLVH